MATRYSTFADTFKKGPDKVFSEGHPQIGGHVQRIWDSYTTVTGDLPANGDVIRLGPAIRTDAIIIPDLTRMDWEAMGGAATTISLGIYPTEDYSGVSSDDTAVLTAQAVVSAGSVVMDADTGYDIANGAQAIWELLGLSEDPKEQVQLAMVVGGNDIANADAEVSVTVYLSTK